MSTFSLLAKMGTKNGTSGAQTKILSPFIKSPKNDGIVFGFKRLPLLEYCNFLGHFSIRTSRQKWLARYRSWVYRFEEQKLGALQTTHQVLFEDQSPTPFFLAQTIDYDIGMEE